MDDRPTTDLIWTDLVYWLNRHVPSFDEQRLAQRKASPGSGLGFNEMKVVEVGRLLRAIAGGDPTWPDIEAALGIERVIHAIDSSARERRWVEVAPR